MPKLRRGLFSLTVLMILLISCNFICSAEESAEKGPAEIGDILYYSYGNQWFPGHAMLYVGWYPVREPKKENLRVIESMPPSEINRRGLVNESTDYIYDYTRTWKEGLSAEQRRKISEFVISKTGLWRYCEDLDHTYQKGQDGIHCDCAGLCEAAYESIGLDPVPREGWILWPEEQCKSSRMKDATPVPPKIRLEPSEDGTLKAYASDEDKGSGITRVEFWDGKPDDTPDEAPGVRLGKDDHNTKIGGYYTIAYDGAVAQLYAKAFDQAGNTKITAPFDDVMVVNIRPNKNYFGCPAINICNTSYVSRVYFVYPSGYTTLHYYICDSGSLYPGGVLLGIYEVDPNSFNLKTLTWNNQPALGSLIETHQISPANTDTWLEIDIKDTEAICMKLIIEEPNEETFAEIYFYSFDDEKEYRPYLTRE